MYTKYLQGDATWAQLIQVLGLRLGLGFSEHFFVIPDIYFYLAYA